MPDTKISADPAADALADADLFPVVQGGANKKATVAQVRAATGDVTGPASSTADALALFSGTGGKTLKDGGTLSAQLAALDAQPPYAISLGPYDMDLIATDSIPFALMPAPGANKVIVPRLLIVRDYTVDVDINAAGHWINSKVLWDGSGDLPFQDFANFLFPLSKINNAFGRVVALPGNDTYNGNPFIDLSNKVNKGLLLSANNGLSFAGELTGGTVSDGGTGFVVSETVEVLSNNGGTNTFATVTSAPGGVVDAVTITPGGTGFERNQTASTQAGGGNPGVGSGLIIATGEAINFSVNPMRLDFLIYYALLSL